MDQRLGEAGALAKALRQVPEQAPVTAERPHSFTTRSIASSIAAFGMPLMRATNRRYDSVVMSA